MYQYKESLSSEPANKNDPIRCSMDRTTISQDTTMKDRESHAYIRLEKSRRHPDVPHEFPQRTECQSNEQVVL